MASMPHGRLGPPLWSFAADAHDCIMVLVRLDRPHTSSWRDAAPVGGLPLRSLWLIPPGAPRRGPQTEPDGGKKPEKKRLTEKAPYKLRVVFLRPTGPIDYSRGDTDLVTGNKAA